MNTNANTTAADGLAVLVTATGSFTPSGRRLTGPVDSIEKLGALLEWSRRTGKLAPSENQQLPQVWIVGPTACENLGWHISLDDATRARPETQQHAMIRAEAHRVALESLPPLIAQGWTVRGAGQRLRLISGNVDVEVIIASCVDDVHTCTITRGLDLTDPAAAGEIARRIREWTAHFHVLPAATSEASGAALADRIRSERQALKRGLTTDTAALIPAEVQSLTDRIQQPWGRIVEVDDIDGPDADELIALDQDQGLLATAGMLALPVGEPTVHTGSAAQELAAARKRSPALWQLTLPAIDDLETPALLPPPDPRMRADASVQVWVTTPGLEGLLAPVIHGGLGLDITDLQITTAITWTKSGRALDKWAAEIRETLDTCTAAGDTALVEMVAAAATDYLTHLAIADPWKTEGLAHHQQPVWWAAICEHTRFRSRRAMLRISREFRLHPITVIDTTLVYAVGTEDLSDPPGPRGRHEVQARIALTDDAIVQLLMPQTGPDVVTTTATMFGQATETACRADEPGTPAEPATSAAAAPPTAAEDKDTSRPTAENSDPRTAEQPAEALTSERHGTTTTAAPNRTNRKSGRNPAGSNEFSGPAAVLDTEGAWLADGTCVPMPENVAHAGDLVAFARTLRLGHRISASYVETGQIWITNNLANKFGIDTATITRANRDEDLRALTASLPFVSLATAAGWQFGNQEEGRPVSLSNWTRVWHRDDADESKTSMWLVLMAGLDDDPDSPDPDMPILVGDPDPATVARRLKLFADTLDFPWKISGPTTGLDLVKEARPKTYGPAEWRETVWARSGFALPSGIGLVARDYAWSRKPTPAEAACKYCHAYDRGGSYLAGLAGLELPIGEPEHKNEGEWEFDPRVPAFILTCIPPAATWELPYVLSPAGRDFGDTPQWVATPQFERALAHGYDLPILEAWIWPSHARLLREWANRFSAAARKLDTEDPDDQAVRSQAKVARVRGYGMLASQHLADAKGPWAPFRPEVWFMGVSKAAANIAHFLSGMYDETGVAILGIDKDTILIASDDPDPVSAWPMHSVDSAKVADNPRHRTTMGRGFGQWKPEASGLMKDQLKHFAGGPYKGKRYLTPYAEWKTRLATP